MKNVLYSTFAPFVRLLYKRYYIIETRKRMYGTALWIMCVNEMNFCNSAPNYMYIWLMSYEYEYKQVRIMRRR